MITDSELLELNRKGIIPGPEETEKAFSERAEYCLNLQSLCEDNDELFAGCENATESAKWLSEAYPITTKNFDIAPDWLPVVFSNYRLHPWHGGCAWIFQSQIDSPLGAIIQLRRQFRIKKKYFFLYDRSELLAHELSHVGRMAFDEPLYEELVAYRTTQSRFRRWLGPLIQSSNESLLFIFMLFVVIGVDFLQLFYEPISLFYLSLGTKALAVIMLIYAFYRLWNRQHTFNKCLNKLNMMCTDDSAEAVAYRLTDKEIELFSIADIETLRKYIEEQKSLSLRWKLIHLAYL